MNQATAQALADGYATYNALGDMSVLRMFSPEFYDNVSGQRGLYIFTIVGGWLEESFAERTVQLHLVTHNDDTVMIWYTMRGRHIGNGFPRLTGLPIKETALPGRRSTSSASRTAWSSNTGPCVTTPPCSTP